MHAMKVRYGNVVGIATLVSYMRHAVTFIPDVNLVKAITVVQRIVKLSKTPYCNDFIVRNTVRRILDLVALQIQTLVSRCMAISHFVLDRKADCEGNLQTCAKDSEVAIIADDDNEVLIQRDDFVSVKGKSAVVPINFHTINAEGDAEKVVERFAN